MGMNQKDVSWQNDHSAQAIRNLEKLHVKAFTSNDC